MNGDNEAMEKISKDIESIKKWSRIQGLETLSSVLEGFDDVELVVYNEADGETAVRDIADAADVSTGYVSTRMNSWSELSIVEKDGRQWKHLAPLRAMGLDVPDLDEESEE